LRTRKDDLEINSDGMLGRYQAFDANGKSIWTLDEYQHGRDQVPHGVSMAMKAGRIVAPDGTILHTWDPYGVLKGVPKPRARKPKATKETPE